MHGHLNVKKMMMMMMVMKMTVAKAAHQKVMCKYVQSTLRCSDF